jgi:hypothetical protein
VPALAVGGSLRLFPSVMSRAILEAPITAPSFRIGDTVNETGRQVPFLRHRIVS